MVTVLLLLCLLTLYGYWEQKRHLSHLLDIPVRIHVNGTRGKSSVTRLIAAGLRAGGKRVIAKTTGTEPRIILEDGREVPIYRIGKPNIIEQITIIRLAWERRADMLVTECMAVRPLLQKFAEEKTVRSTVGVITNARADHLDEMGPTVGDVAEALSLTIPRKGTLFTVDSEWMPVFRRHAEGKGSRAVLIPANQVTARDMEGFQYVEHGENVALALGVCGHFGVSRDAALKSMKEANPDPGVLRAYRIRFQSKEILFYNAFAANDRDSTLRICRMLQLKNTREHPLMMIINNRGDRLQRAEQFGVMMAKDLDAACFFLIGDITRATAEIAVRRGISPDRIVNLGAASPEEVFEAVLTKTEHRSTVLGVGNIGGMGKDLVFYFKNRGEEWLNKPSDLDLSSV